MTSFHFHAPLLVPSFPWCRMLKCVFSFKAGSLCGESSLLLRDCDSLLGDSYITTLYRSYLVKLLQSNSSQPLFIVTLHHNGEARATIASFALTNLARG